MREKNEESDATPITPGGNDDNTGPAEPIRRRRLLQALAIGGTGSAIGPITTWVRPRVQSVILPAHAAATGGDVPRVSNDRCENAIPVGCDSLTPGSTRNATSNDAPGTCTTTLNTAPGVWYSLVGDGTTITIDTCTGTNFDTKLGVFAGPCGDFDCVGGNDDACGLQSSVTFASSDGQAYLIYVTGFGSAVGEFQLRVSCNQTP